MKAKRILSLFLALLSVFGMMSVLSSCNKKDGNIALSGKTVDIDLTGYAVVYADALNKSRYAQSVLAGLADLVSEKTEKSVMARAFTKTNSTAADPEILIGQTTREQSVKALSSIKGDGFTIQVVDNKIVIVGTNNLLTLQALNYFTQNYINASEGKSITVNKTVKANKVEMIRLAESDAEEAGITFVYDDTLHDKVAHPDPTFVGTYSGRDMREYPVQAIDGVIKQLASITGQKEKQFKSKKDTEEIDGATFYMGMPDADVVKACLQELAGDEYGIFVRDGSFVITAWSDAALISANDAFIQLLDEATFTEGEKKYVAFPEGFRLISVSNENWITDFPLPEGLELYNTYDTANNCLQYLYMGESVNEAAFTAYCAKLEAAGYSLMQDNEIEGSKYATYHNADKEHMVYVAYNAFAHASEYGPFDGWYASSYGDKLLRVVSMPTNDEFCVPDNSILKPQSYKKVTDMQVTAIGLGKGAVGMGYIVTLEDGSFIIFDGGMMGDSAQEHVQIYDILLKQYQKIYGENTMPTANQPIRIAAWVITHSHADHYVVPRKVLQVYGKNYNLKLDYLIGNFAAPGSIYPVYNSDTGKMGEAGVIEEMLTTVSTPFKFIKAHSGQKYYFANVEMEVLMTYDDHNPNPVVNTNDTNTIVRFSCSSKDAPSADPYTMVWLGDANQRQSRYLCAMYGDYLESDLVQLAHHGNVGSESDLYDTIKAAVVLFPNSVEAYRSYTSPANKNGTYCYGVDYRIVYENPHTEYVIVSGPDFHTTFSIVNGEPVYEFVCARTGVSVPVTTDKEQGGQVVKIKAD